MKPLVFKGLSVCVLIIVTCEIVLRIVGLGNPVLVARDAELEYRLIPNADYTRWGNRISINGYGLRTEDYPGQVPEGERRILLVGDSVVYGNHLLDQSETLSVRMSELLSTPECKVRVIPAAASSWGPVNQAAFLARHGSFGATEIAIVLSGHDVLDVPTENGSVVPYRLKRPFGATGDAIESIIERSSFRQPPSTSLTLEQRAAASLVALNAIVDHARKTNAGLVFVYNATPTERKNGTSRLGRRLFEWAELQGLKAIDLGGVPKIRYRDDIHPDAEGAGRIAQVLSEEYSERAKCQ